MNNISPTTKIALGVLAVLAVAYSYWEDSQQPFQQSFDQPNNGWVRGQNGPGPGQQGRCPPGTLPAVGPGSQGGCAPIPGGQANNQYPNQYPNQGPNQYPNQYPNQGPNQYPNQYPNQGSNQYPNQYPNQGPNQYPNQYPQDDGYYMDSGEVDLGPQTEPDDEW